jgi:hypothetical protein
VLWCDLTFCQIRLNCLIGKDNALAVKSQQSVRLSSVGRSMKPASCCTHNMIFFL